MYIKKLKIGDIELKNVSFAYDENVINLAKLSILTASMASIIVTQMALYLKHSRVAAKIKYIVG